MLKLVRRHKGGNYYLRGTVAGQHIYESTGCGIRSAAEAIRIRRESEILARHACGKSATLTFAAAALTYMESGGQARYLTRILRHFGPDTLLEDIDNATVNTAASALYPDAAPATINRQLITPISAVVNMAAENDLIVPSIRQLGFVVLDILVHFCAGSLEACYALLVVADPCARLRAPGCLVIRMCLLFLNVMFAVAIPEIIVGCAGLLNRLKTRILVCPGHLVLVFGQCPSGFLENVLKLNHLVLTCLTKECSRRLRIVKDADLDLGRLIGQLLLFNVCTPRCYLSCGLETIPGDLVSLTSRKFIAATELVLDILAECPDVPPIMSLYIKPEVSPRKIRRSSTASSTRTRRS